jgi:hypothetical protein
MKRSRRPNGVAIVEFSFAMVVLIPLFLGTVGVGLRLIQSLRVIQLSRDAGKMYARGLDFSQPGNKTLLANLGEDIGLQTTDSGTSTLILTTVVYIDAGMCQLGGHSLDGSGNPIDCPNWKSWVFAQRLVIGKRGLRTSNLGSPITSVTDGTIPVTVDATTGKISLSDQVDNPNDQATFAAGNPFVSDTFVLNTLPSGQVLYVTEVAISGFSMPPFVSGGTVYAYNVF